MENSMSLRTNPTPFLVMEIWKTLCVYTHSHNTAATANHQTHIYPYKPLFQCLRYILISGRPAGDKRRCQAFLILAPCFLFLPLYAECRQAPVSTIYVRPFLREPHQPFHPIGIERRCFRYWIFLFDYLRREVRIAANIPKRRRFECRAVAVRRYRRQIEHRRRKRKAPFCSVWIDLAEYPVVREVHIHILCFLYIPVVGRKGRGKHQRR